MVVFATLGTTDAAPRTGLQPESRISITSSRPGITSPASFTSWTASRMASSVNAPLVVFKGTNAPILTFEKWKFLTIFFEDSTDVVENGSQHEVVKTAIMGFYTCSKTVSTQMNQWLNHFL